MASNKQYIIQTLCYFIQFNYPLTREQLWKYMSVYPEKGTIRLKKEHLEQECLTIPHIVKKNNFYILKEFSSSISSRLKKEKESARKIQIAKRTVSVLSLLPTVWFIGISGGLAMRNAGKDDDIDFFIITKRGTLWMTRLILLLLLQILGKRKNASRNKDAICLNMFMTENHLQLPKERWDFYTAHEIVQMEPLYEKNNMYEAFLISNDWVKKFLPHSVEQKKRGGIQSGKEYYMPFFFLSFFESVSRFLQLWYMGEKKEKYTLSDSLLAFHMRDYRKNALSSYMKYRKTYLSSMVKS